MALGLGMMHCKSACPSCNLPLHPAEIPLCAGALAPSRTTPAQLLSREGGLFRVGGCAGLFVGVGSCKWRSSAWTERVRGRWRWKRYDKHTKLVLTGVIELSGRQGLKSDAGRDIIEVKPFSGRERRREEGQGKAEPWATEPGWMNGCLLPATASNALCCGAEWWQEHRVFGRNFFHDLKLQLSFEALATLSWEECCLMRGWWSLPGEFPASCLTPSRIPGVLWRGVLLDEWLPVPRMLTGALVYFPHSARGSRLWF